MRLRFAPTMRSACSIPSITRPKAAYSPSRCGASATMRKNCEPAESGRMVRALSLIHISIERKLAAYDVDVSPVPLQKIFVYLTKKDGEAV